ncbi:MAG: GNAT family N-acetyltransferase [Gemmatimonadetes bacterium]|nr:GNAT family N-acetyltransferase [Gemmatimonadota bacterium]
MARSQDTRRPAGSERGPGRPRITDPVTLATPALRHEEAFLAAVKRSRRLHGSWVKAPSTSEQFRAFVRRGRAPTHECHLVLDLAGELVGVVNISEIVRGVFLSGYLGFYAFTPNAGRGLMRAGLRLVVDRAFREYELHRLEANVQPGNLRSRGLVESLGFRLEGFSPRYLKIAGRWRDHERWAITVEDWKAHRKGRRAA